MTQSHRAKSRLTRRALACIAAMTIAGAVSTGCATTQAADKPAAPKNKDPIQGFNRGVYKFNDALDRHLLRPVAVAYHDHTPAWLQQGVGNFYQNLFYPTTIVNQFLQGKFMQGGQDIARFAINTTLGWGGVLDVASGAHLPVHDEDTGQTLGRWGVPPGPYLVMPFLGPATVRDAPAKIADTLTQPLYWYSIGDARWFSLALSTVDMRAKLLQVDRAVREAYDPYAFMRDAYLQRRQYQVYDGNPPEEPVEDDWAEEALKEDEAGAPVDPGSGAGTNPSPAETTPSPPQPDPGAPPASPPH